MPGGLPRGAGARRTGLIGGLGRRSGGHRAPCADYGGALERARARVRAYLAYRSRLGEDLLKRILVYTLLMKGPFPEEALLRHVWATPWFPDTVDRYFPGAGEAKYREAVEVCGSGAPCAWKGGGSGPPYDPEVVPG